MHVSAKNSGLVLVSTSTQVVVEKRRTKQNTSEMEREEAKATSTFLHDKHVVVALQKKYMHK